MKKCPTEDCLNYMDDNEILCNVCKSQKGIPIQNEGIKADVFSILERGKCYGTKAQDIYEGCCRSFGWNICEKGKFAFQQKLYAEKADKERKRGVWFIAHSNRTGSKSEKWTNRILSDVIEEDYSKGASPNAFSKNDRIVFAKNKYNEYEFLGIYKVESQTSEQRVYKLINPKYT